MFAITDEVGLTNNLIAYWNLDNTLPLYPDNTSTFYKRYDTYADWAGTGDISAANAFSVLSRDYLNPDLLGEIIITQTLSSLASKVGVTFTLTIPTGVTNINFSAYGFDDNIYIDAVTSSGTITKLIGKFDTNWADGVVGSIASFSWKNFSICLGNYSISSITIYTNAPISTTTAYDFFKIDWLTVSSNSQYFNNNFITNGGWTGGATYTGGILTQPSGITLSQTFTGKRLDGMRFRAAVAITSGSNPILAITSGGVSQNAVLTTDGLINIVEVILPTIVSTSADTTITLTSVGNVLAYSFIYIGLGNYFTSQPDSSVASQALYSVGVKPVVGIYGNAYSFYKSFAYTNFNLNFNYSTSLTIGFLMYIDTLPTLNATMLTTIPTTTGVKISVGLTVVNGDTYLSFSYIDVLLATKILVGKTIVTPNAWHYVTMTHSGTAATIYLDGVPDPSFISSLNMPSTNQSTLLLGGSDTCGTNYFAGKIQEIRVYSYAAVAADILAQYNYFKTFISVTISNYAATAETGLFANYSCLGFLPDPPDELNKFYFDCLSYPYNLTNVNLLNSTFKINNGTSVTYFSQGDTTVGFSVPVNIAAGNNYFRINVAGYTTSSTTLYADITRNGIVTTVLLTNSMTINSSTFEYISYLSPVSTVFGSTVFSNTTYFVNTNSYIGKYAISNIKIYMNSAFQGDGFTVNWIYYGTGTDTATLSDISGNNNNTTSLVEVFNDAIAGLNLTGYSSIFLPPVAFAGTLAAIPVGGFSISFWIATASSKNQIVYTKKMPPEYSINTLSIAINDGNVIVGYSKTFTIPGFISTITSPVILGAFNQIVVTYVNSVFYIYVNGNQIISQADVFKDGYSISAFGSGHPYETLFFGSITFSPTTFFGMTNYMNNSMNVTPTLFSYATMFSSSSFFGVSYSNINVGKFASTVFSTTTVFSGAVFFGKVATNEISFRSATVFGLVNFGPTTVSSSTAGIDGVLNKMRIYSRGLTAGEVKYLNTNNM